MFTECFQNVHRSMYTNKELLMPTFNQTTQLIEHDLRNAGIFVDMNGTTFFQSGENVATKELLFVSCICQFMCFNVNGTVSHIDPLY